MKRLGLLVAFSFVAVCGVGQDYAIFRGPCHTYQPLSTDLKPGSYEIGYIDELGTFYLSTGEADRAAWIDLTSDDLAQLRGILNKYFQSEKNPPAKRQETTQALSRITTSAHWMEDDKWYEADGLDLLFTSIFKTDGTSLLEIRSNTVSASDSTESYHLASLLFHEDEAQRLAEGISKTNIDSALSEREKRSSQ